jgi:hypothetical protein
MEDLRPRLAAVLRRGRNIDRAATVGSEAHLAHLCPASGCARAYRTAALFHATTS